VVPALKAIDPFLGAEIRGNRRGSSDLTRDHSTYEFTLAVKIGCVVLVSVPRVLESRKVKARTEE